MRTLVGKLRLAVGFSATALVIDDNGRETQLGLCPSTQSSLDEEKATPLVPMTSRSGRIFFTEQDKEGKGSKGEKVFVVPASFKIAAGATCYDVGQTEAEGFKTIDLSACQSRFVAFLNDMKKLVVIDLAHPSSECVLGFQAENYDLWLCRQSDDELTALPIPSWNGHCYQFSDGDFIDLDQPTEDLSSPTDHTDTPFA